MAINVGSVSVSVVPDAGRFATDLRRDLLPDASRVGDDLGRTIGERVGAKIGDAVQRGVTDGGRAAGAQGARVGEDFGGSFAETAKRRIEAALRDLPKPNVGVDATALDAELADIRARMAALSSIKIGVDLDTAAALAEMDALRVRLDELGARSPDIRVKVDAAAAAAELAAVQAEVDKLDGDDVNIRVDDHGTTGQAVSGMGALATAGIALGPAIIPVAAAAAAAVAGIGAGAFAAVGGLGVLALGFSGITKAVQELTQQHAQAGAVAARSAATQVSSAAAIANAQQGVADANRGVADAERRLGDARRAVADAERSAAQGVQTALGQEQAAEGTLAAAQRAARQAQLDLTAARRQAKQDLEDLTLQVEDGALAQRQANLDVQAARENLNKTLMDPTATALQRQQAQLSYDQAVQQVTDLGVRQQRLTDQQKAASKAGVAGAAGVVAATQKVADTHAAVIKAAHDEEVAQAAVVEARRAGAEQIAKAQETVLAAQEAIGVAQTRVVTAERQVAVAHAQAASAAEAGTARTTKAFDELGPAGQRLATFIATTVVPAFDRIRDAAQAGLAPGMERGLRALAPLLPGLTALVGSLATTMGDLFEQGAKALTSPFWTQFFGFLSSTMGPNLKIFVGIVANVIKGFAGLFEAFGPLTTEIGKGLEHLTKRFGDFGAAAGSNPAVQRFIDYVRQTGPEVIRVLGKIVDAVVNIVEALAPLGPVVLGSIGFLADVIASIPTGDLTVIAAGLIAMALGVKAVAIAMAILDANPITLIVVAIAALATGLVIAYRHSQTFRDIVKGAMHVVAAAFDFVKDHWRTFATVFAGLMFGPVIGAVVAVVTHWNGVKGVARDVTGFLHDKWDAFVGFFEKLPRRIAGAAKGMWGGIAADFKSVINTIIGWWDDFVGYLKIPGFSLDTHIPGVPKAHFGGLDIGGDLKIPFLASGGVGTAATLGMFAERGAEAVLPLTDPHAMKLITDAMARNGGSRGPLIGQLTVNNPAPEPTSRSLPKVIQRAEFDAGYSL